MESATKKRRKRSFWDNNTEAYFVDLWGEKIDELRGDKKNTQVYQEMSAELAKHGVELAVSDIKYKIANLTTKYKKCREALETSAGDASVMWPLYKQVHQIIGSQFFNPSHTEMTFEESMDHKFNLAETTFLTPLAASLSTPSYDSNAFTLPPSYITDVPSSKNMRGPKRQSSEKLISMCECLQATADEKNKLMKEMVAVEKEKLEVLKDLRDDNKKLLHAIINYLSRKQL